MGWTARKGHEETLTLLPRCYEFRTNTGNSPAVSVLGVQVVARGDASFLQVEQGLARVRIS